MRAVNDMKNYDTPNMQQILRTSSFFPLFNDTISITITFQMVEEQHAILLH